MKKVFISIALLFSFSMADSVLLIKQGWQLIGSSQAITDMSKFDAENVEEVWHFDATTQQWRGYSPDATTQAKMNDQNISQLSSLQNWHGFWVKSKQEWALTLKDNAQSSVPNDNEGTHDTIQLKAGWNLISLPVDTVVSADIFKDMTVWKYNSTQKWELFDQTSSETEFSPLGHIKNSDGIWVQAVQDTNISIMNEASKLHNFASTEAMEAHIKEMVTLNNRPYWGIQPLAFERGFAVNDGGVAEISTVDTATAPTQELGSSTSNSSESVENATETNLQESGVDESDIVKHNGVTIFYTTRSSWDQNNINITTFEALVNGNTQALQRITFDDQRQIDSLYLLDNKLIVLSHAYSDYHIMPVKNATEATSLPHPNYETPQTIVDIFDVSDINAIQKLSHYKIDGHMVTSRVVNNKLYLVSTFNPKVTIDYPKEYVTLSETCKKYFDDNYYYGYPEDSGAVSVESNPETGVSTTTDAVTYPNYAACYNIQTDDGKTYYRYNYENPTVTIQDLIPEIEDNDQNRVALITPERLYASAKKNQATTMTSISEIDLSDGNYQQSNSFMGYSYTQYASTNALYLVSTEYPIYYDFNNYKERSTIYKFNFDAKLNYQGIGAVYGTPLNQFALSEHRDTLRIATTEGFSWGSSGTNNSVYTLQAKDQQLKIQGVLSGLGKEGETIYAVRFMGDKGYVVTFRQTDPLYTIDLSDPTAPQKVGELHVNGYSSYLHPVGEDKLLGIGRDATADGQVLGLKLELFDISDFANPTSIDHISYGRKSFSELEYNHKALAYRSSDDLFAFPYQDYTNYQAKNYLGLYQIKDNDLVAYTPITSTSAEYWWGQHRGIIFDFNDTTYASFFAGDTVQTEKVITTK